MSIVLSETRVWLAADTITATATAATNAPASNLKDPRIFKFFQDTVNTSSQGFTWNYNGVEVDAWAFVVCAINDAGETSNRNFIMRLDDVSPYDGTTVIMNTAVDTYSPISQYGITGTPETERTDIMVCLGIDALTGVTVTGAPTDLAHKSGLFWWQHTGAVHPDGYHRASALLIGINALTFPDPSEYIYKPVRLRKGYGWEVTIGWRYMPEVAASGAGGNELDNLCRAQWHSPIIALLDTAGLDGTGIPNNAEAAPWRRLGACQIVSKDDPAAYFGPVANLRSNFKHNLTLRTWEERPAELVR